MGAGTPGGEGSLKYFAPNIDISESIDPKKCENSPPVVKKNHPVSNVFVVTIAITKEERKRTTGM